MSSHVHTTHIRIVKDKGPIKRAYIDNLEAPVRYGLNTNIKKFYKNDCEEELPATLDHLVAAVGGCLVGTFGGSLDVRGITSADNLTADVEGDMEDIDGVLVITRIRVRYHVKVPKEKREAAERALAKHESKCATATSVKRGIAIECQADIEEI